MTDLTAWRPHRIAAAHLELDLIDGPPVIEEELVDGAQVFQAADPIVLGVRYGAGHTLAEWRRRFADWPPASVEAEVREQLAGLEARRLETTITPVQGGEGAFQDSRGDTVYSQRELPGRVVVAIGFKHRDVPIIAHWSVPLDLRADYAEAERHFFAALKPF